MRADALEARSEMNPIVYQEKTKLGHEIAEVLRKNIVQGRRVQDAQDETEKDVWRRVLSHYVLYHYLL